MEGVAAGESVAAVLGLCLKIYKYAQDVAKASEEQEQLRTELEILSTLLERVRGKYGETPQESGIMNTVEQIQLALEKIDVPPKKQNCWRKALNRGSWPIRKESIIEARGRIRYLNSVLQAFTGLSIEGGVREVKGNVLEVKGTVDNIWTGQQGSTSALLRPLQKLTFLCSDSAAKAGRDELKKVVDWICPPTFERKHQTIRLQRTEATNDWILDEESFRNWMDQKTGLLWCRGMRKGKTSLFCPRLTLGHSWSWQNLSYVCYTPIKACSLLYCHANDRCVVSCPNLA